MRANKDHYKNIKYLPEVISKSFSHLEVFIENNIYGDVLIKNEKS